MNLDRAGFYAKTKTLTKEQMHEKLLALFDLAQFAETDGELSGDWNWELSKKNAGLPSKAV